MAKKEFNKRFMHPTRRKLVDMVMSGGNYEKNTTIGFTGNKKETRKVGDVWEDEHNRYEKKDGYTLKTSKNSEALQEIRDYIAKKNTCKNKDCSKIKKGPTDKKLIRKTGFCSKCLAEKELEIKMDGLWEEYNQYKVYSNMIDYGKDVLRQLNDAYENAQQSYEYVNDDGTTEKWDIGMSVDELKESIKEDIEKYTKELNEVIDKRVEVYEKLKDKNYELVTKPE